MTQTVARPEPQLLSLALKTDIPNTDSARAIIFGSYWYALELLRHLYHCSRESLRSLAQSVGIAEEWRITIRGVFIKASTPNLVDHMLFRVGISRAPLAKAKPPSLPFKVVPKTFRLTLLPVQNGIASLAGDGESIHGVLRKESA